jgi:hypothetical protein
MTRIASQRWLWAVALVGAGAAASSAKATETSTATERGGISIQAQRLQNHVSFCVRSDGDHKVSSEFGIEFRIEHGDPRMWAETFPKLITADGWYFSLPMRVNLATRRSFVGQVMHVELGACSVKDNNCDRLDYRIAVPEKIATTETGCE